MIRLHVDTVLEHLKTDPFFTGRVVDASKVGIQAPPYIVFESDDGIGEGERESTSRPSRYDFDFRIHIAGEDADQVRLWRERLRARLDWKPVVEGWRPTRLHHYFASPILRDTDFDPIIFHATDSFDMTSRPGS